MLYSPAANRKSCGIRADLIDLHLSAYLYLLSIAIRAIRCDWLYGVTVNAKGIA
jgi:hypothetical protein